MTKSFALPLFIFLGGLFLITSCGDLYEDFDKDIEIPEKRDPRFLQCYYEEDLAKHKCDSVLRTFFGNNAFSFITLNPEKSFIGCDETEDLKMLSFGDENCCAPRTYDLIYDVTIDNKLIHEIPMMAGSEMNFDFISPQYKTQLEGYKFLLEDKLKIDYKDLCELLKEEDMQPENYSIELVRDTLFPNDALSAFFWEIYSESDDDELLMTTVHAMSGEFIHIRKSNGEAN